MKKTNAQYKTVAEAMAAMFPAMVERAIQEYMERRQVWDIIEEAFVQPLRDAKKASKKGAKAR